MSPVFPVGRPTQWWEQLCKQKKGWQHTDCETQVQWPRQHHGLFPWPHAAFVLSVSICAAVRRPAFQAGLSCEWHLPTSALLVFCFYFNFVMKIHCQILMFLVTCTHPHIPITFSLTVTEFAWCHRQSLTWRIHVCKLLLCVCEQE